MKAIEKLKELRRRVLPTKNEAMLCLLTKSRDYIADGKKWIQGKVEDDYHNVCAVGSVYLQYRFLEKRLRRRFPYLACETIKILDNHSPDRDVIETNDRRGQKSHSAVIKTYDSAIQDIGRRLAR